MSLSERKQDCSKKEIKTGLRNIKISAGEPEHIQMQKIPTHEGLHQGNL